MIIFAVCAASNIDCVICTICSGLAKEPCTSFIFYDTPVHLLKNLMLKPQDLEVEQYGFESYYCLSFTASTLINQPSFLLQGASLLLMKVERKRRLNQVARLHVLFLKFFSMNKFENYRNLQNGVLFFQL